MVFLYHTQHAQCIQTYVSPDSIYPAIVHQYYGISTYKYHLDSDIVNSFQDVWVIILGAGMTHYDCTCSSTRQPYAMAATRQELLEIEISNTQLDY